MSAARRSRRSRTSDGARRGSRRVRAGRRSPSHMRRARARGPARASRSRRPDRDRARARVRRIRAARARTRARASTRPSRSRRSASADRARRAPRAPGRSPARSRSRASPAADDASAARARARERLRLRDVGVELVEPAIERVPDARGSNATIAAAIAIASTGAYSRTASCAATPIASVAAPTRTMTRTECRLAMMPHSSANARPHVAACAGECLVTPSGFEPELRRERPMS